METKKARMTKLLVSNNGIEELVREDKLLIIIIVISNNG